MKKTKMKMYMVKKYEKLKMTMKSRMVKMEV